MKNLILLGLTGMVILFAGACGAAPDLEKVKSGLAAAQAKIDAFQTKVNDLQSQIGAREADLKSARDKVSQIGTKVEVLKEYLNTPGAINLTPDAVKAFLDKVRDKVNASNDQALISSFKSAESAGTVDALKAFLKDVVDSASAAAK